MTKNNWQINEFDEKLILQALQEDLGLAFHDATTQTLFDSLDNKYSAKIISKAGTPIILSGIPIVDAVLDTFQQAYKIETSFNDGDLIKPGETILKIHSDAQTLLMAERIILNFLQHLCAVATTTYQFTEKVKHTSMKILDTRKTTPGWRHLEKYAVACGGGVNHRLGLYDAIMIKDTHIDLIGGIEKALAKIPERNEESLPVIIEVRNKDELQQAITHGRKKIDRVLLDNMSPPLLKECVERCKGVFATEASGNINLDTVATIAESGVDYASVGMLTHSAGNVDLSMKAI